MSHTLKYTSANRLSVHTHAQSHTRARERMLGRASSLVCHLHFFYRNTGTRIGSLQHQIFYYNKCTDSDDSVGGISLRRKKKELTRHDGYYKYH